MISHARLRLFRSCILLIALSSVSPVAQERAAQATPRFSALRWRGIGPYRGGRVTAVAGVSRQPNVYYLGATGGGVWKTDDAGVTWLPVSVRVHPSNPDIRRDPRLSTTDADLQQQFDLLIRIRDRVTATHEAANRILAIRERLAPLAGASPRARSISDAAQALDTQLASILDALVQMKIRSGNDVLSYPIRLNNQIASVGSVVAGAEARPTDQAVDAFRELTTALDAELARLNAALDTQLTRLNEQLRAAGQVPILVSQP